MPTQEALEVVEQHARLRETLQALEATLRRPPASLRDLDAVRRLAQSLERLCTLLREHFGYEERSGLFEQMLSARPETAHAVARLRGEHARLSRRAENLCEGGERALELGYGEALFIEIGSLLDAIRRHESEEEALLVETVEGVVPALD
ncbi:MAG: hemerythrin domain-containing protein [Vicinamibacteria bacterium]